MSQPQEKLSTPNRVIHKPDPLCVVGYTGWTTVPGKGHAVIAMKDIKAGTVIERCPVLIMPWRDLKTRDGHEPVIESYIYLWGPEDENEENADVVMAKAGHLVMYNHSEDPNITLRDDLENKVMEITALRDILEGEELTCNYSCELWFDYEP